MSAEAGAPGPQTHGCREGWPGWHRSRWSPIGQSSRREKGKGIGGKLP